MCIRDSKEGAEDPQFLLISRDAGTTWETIPWKWNPPGTLLRVEDFRFLDSKHGTVFIKSAAGRGAMFQSSDAGNRGGGSGTSSQQPMERKRRCMRGNPNRFTRPSGSGRRT